MLEIKKRKALRPFGLKPMLIKKELGCGADGYVYAYGKTKAIKIAEGSRMDHRAVKKRMWYICKRRSSVAKIYKWGVLPMPIFSPGYFILMERLTPIHFDMREFFTDFRDRYLVDYLMGEDKISNSDYWVDLETDDQKRVKHFLRSVRQMKWWHHDLHGRNVMQDKKGNLKMVDMDSLMPRFKDYENSATDSDRP